MIAIGVGCRKNCPAADIFALVREALAALPAGIEADVLANTLAAGLFSIVDKRDEAGLVAAAARLGLPLTFYDTSVLQRFAGAAETVSPRIQNLRGLPSIAETAAMAGAGRGAVLLVPRLASQRATCAIAGAVWSRGSEAAPIPGPAIST